MKYKFLLLIIGFLVCCISCEKDKTYEAGVYMYDSQLFSIIPAAVCDIDGNTYDAVRLGTQVWMIQNLRTTKFADGTPIIHGNEFSSTEAYWYYPNNDSSNKSTYGLLYNWKAVMHNAPSSSTCPSGVQGICPTGWHVPSDAEWDKLIDFVGSRSQYVCGNNTKSIAKALASTTGWNTSEVGCTIGNSPADNNATGFSALPAGTYEGSYGHFGKVARFWSSTGDGNYAKTRYLVYANTGVTAQSDEQDCGFSVRCICDGDYSSAEQLPCITTTATTNVTSSSATTGGNITSAGGSPVTTRGVCWSTSPNPTINDNHTTNGTGTGSFTSNITGLSANTTYYVRAYATNSSGTAYGNEVSIFTFACGISTIKDRDGNTYNTVQIGSQCWMKENLRTTKYADGTSISQGSGTYSNTVGYWYYPNNISSNKPSYGLLYNFKAVMRNSTSSSDSPSGILGICPTGWHVPSNAEWTQLTYYVSSQSQYVCGNGSTTIAKALSATTGWSSSTNTCAVGNDPSCNNATGFSTLPAGFYTYISGSSGTYFDLHQGAYFWSATRLDSYATSKTYVRYLYCDKATVGIETKETSDGYSVRCVKD